MYAHQTAADVANWECVASHYSKIDNKGGEVMNGERLGETAGRRSWNWRIWAGFLVTLAGVASYVLFFLRFPITRNVPWVTFLFFGLAAVLFVGGLRKAYGESRRYRGKVAGPILAGLSLALASFFSYGVLYASKQLPASKGAPHVGEKAPEFSLSDTHGKTVTLAELLAAPTGSPAAPPKGVLLVFYRGYW